MPNAKAATAETAVAFLTAKGGGFSDQCGVIGHGRVDADVLLESREIEKHPLQSEGWQAVADDPCGLRDADFYFGLDAEQQRLNRQRQAGNVGLMVGEGGAWGHLAKRLSALEVWALQQCGAATAPTAP